MSECPRCQGLLVNVGVVGVDLGGQEVTVDMIRCINCGWLWDPVIQHHRDTGPPLWPVTKTGRRRAPRTSNRRPDEDELTEKEDRHG